MADFIPDNQFVPDQPAQLKQPAAIEQPGMNEHSDFVPDEQFVSDQDKYGTPGQLAIGTAEALSRGLVSRPVTTAVERAFGATPETIAGREAALGAPLSTALEITGFAAPAIASAGASALAKTAAIAPETASAIANLSRLSQAGIIDSFGTQAAALAANPVGRAALKLGAEGVLMATLDEANKPLMSNEPTLTRQGLQSALINITASGVLGAGLGAVLGKIKPLWYAKQGVQTAEALNAVKNGIESQPADFFQSAQPFLRPEEQEGLLAGLREQKPNAEEVIRAGEIIGAPVTEGMTSANNTVQSVESSLMKSPTPIGAQRNLLYKQGFEATENAIGNALKTELPENISKAQIGEQVFDSLNQKIEAVKKPIDDLYSLIKESTPFVPVNTKSINKVVQNLLKQDVVKVTESSPAATFIKKIANDLGNVQNVDQLRAVRNSLNQYVGENPVLAHFASDIRERINNLETNSIKNAASQLIVPAYQGKQAVESLLKNIEEASASYAPFKEDLKSLAQGLGIGKIGGAEDFLQKLDKTKPEKIVDRIFANKDSRFLNFFNQKFPEEFKAVSDFQKRTMLNDVTKTGSVSSARAFTLFDKLSAEMRQIMFSPEELRQIEASRIWLNNLPKNINPSDTSKGIAYNEFWRNPLSALGMTTGDAGKLAFIKFLASEKPVNAAAFKATADYFEHAINGIKVLQNAAESIFTGARLILPQKLFDKPKLEKLDKKVQHFKQLPTAMLDLGGDLGHYLPEISQAMGEITSNVVNYVDQNRPLPAKNGMLDTETPVSSAKQQSFYRTLQIADQPLVVMQHIKDGTLMSKDVKDLQNMYPDLYTQMRNVITNSMIKHISDKGIISFQTRKTLSLFMGEPLDSTMKPASIQAAQSIFVPSAAQLGPQMATNRVKKSTAPLSKLAKAYETPAETRQQHLKI